MKRSKIIFFCRLFMFTMLFAFSVAFTSEASSETESSDNSYSKIIYYKDVAAYRTEPEEIDGYVFSGWFSDESCEYGTQIASSYKSGPAYAKYVPEEILGVKVQTTSKLWNDDTADDTEAALRFVTSVDTLNYRQVGFIINIGGEDNYKSNRYVYKKLYVEVGDGNSAKTEKYVPSDLFHESSEYFKTWTVTGIEEIKYLLGFDVTPYWVTLDGTTVMGTAKQVTVNDVRSWDYVFVDDSGEADNNHPGIGTRNYPYKSIEGALDAMDAALTEQIASEEEYWNGDLSQVTLDRKSTVYVVSSITGGYTYSESAGYNIGNWTAHGLNVTFKTAPDKTVNATIDLTDTLRMVIRDDVTFDDVVLKLHTTNNGQIYAYGNSLTITGNCDVNNIKSDNTAATTIYGGGYYEDVTSTDVQLYTGLWRNVYAGGFKSSVDKDASVLLAGDVNSSIDASDDENYTNTVFGGCGETGTVAGDTHVTVKGTAKIISVRGGGNGTSVVEGTCYVCIDENAQAYGVNGGASGGTANNTYVLVNGGTIYQLFGGNTASGGTVNNTNIQILGGTIKRRIYGGSYNETGTFSGWADTNYFVNGYSSVTIGNEATISLNTDIDNSLCAVSRNGSNINGEIGVLILNSGKTGIEKGFKDMFGYSVAELYAHFLVNVTGDGTVTAESGVLRVNPDTDGTWAKITDPNSSVTYIQGDGTYSLSDLGTPTSMQTITVEFVEAPTETPSGNYVLSYGDGSASYFSTLEAAMAAVSTPKLSVDGTVNQKTATITIDENCTIDSGFTLSDNDNIVLKNADGVCVTITRGTSLTDSYMFNVPLGCSLEIAGSLVVDGNKANVVGPSIIYNEGTFTLAEGATIQNASTGAGADSETNYASDTYRGAALHNRNKAYIYGNMIGNHAYDGGAIFMAAGGTVTLYTEADARFADNTATANGGAISIYNGTLIATGYTFDSNSATNGGTLELRRATAVANVDNCEFVSSNVENDATSGGAVYVKAGGSLTTTNCAFTGIKATNGGAIYVVGEYKPYDCTFNKNIATENGGAIYVDAGTVNGADSVFVDNVATKTKGGAIFLTDNNAVVTLVASSGSTKNYFRGNESKTEGGAIAANKGTVVVDGYTFIGNTATTYGGAIYLNEWSNGASLAQAYINNCVFGGTGEGEQNTAQSEGGAIYAKGYLKECKNSVFINNTATTGGAIHLAKTTCGTDNYLSNCVFGGNTATTGSGINIASGSFVSIEGYLDGAVFNYNADEAAVIIKGRINSSGAITITPKSYTEGLQVVNEVTESGYLAQFATTIGVTQNGDERWVIDSEGKLKGIPVAQIGETQYYTFDAAMDAAIADEATDVKIIVIDEAVVSKMHTIPAQKNITVTNAEGQDITLTRKVTDTIFAVETDGKLTITGETDGSIIVDGGAKSATPITATSLIKNAGEFLLGANATIQNAQAGTSQNEDNKGAALYNTGTATICGNFIGNSGYNGGAIYIADNGIANIPETSGAYFEENKAAYQGGAIFINKGTLNATNAKFVANQATDSGGAIFVNNWGTVTTPYSSATLKQCEFDVNEEGVGNTSLNEGGAIHVRGRLEVSECTFNKQSAKNGGAIAVFSNGNYAVLVDVSNSTFTENTSSNRGGAVDVNGGTSEAIEFTGCTFSQNEGNTGNAINVCSGKSIFIDGGTFAGSSKDSNAIVNLQMTDSSVAQAVLSGKLTGVTFDYGSTGVGILVNENGLSDESDITITPSEYTDGLAVIGTTGSATETQLANAAKIIKVTPHENTGWFITSEGKLSNAIAQSGTTTYANYAEVKAAIEESTEPMTIEFIQSTDATELISIASGKDITITSVSGKETTLTRTCETSLFDVAEGGKLTITGTTEGSMVIDGGSKSETSIKAVSLVKNSGEFTLGDNATIQNANAGTSSSGCNGGALYNSGTANLSGDFIENQGYNGGAIYNNNGTLNIIGGIYSENIGVGQGGAIYIANGTDSASIANAEITLNDVSNTSSRGVAIYVQGLSKEEKTKLTLTGCNIHDNTIDGTSASDPGCDILIADGTSLTVEDNINLGIVQQKWDTKGVAQLFVEGETIGKMILIPVVYTTDESLVTFNTDAVKTYARDIVIRKVSEVTVDGKKVLEYNDDTYCVDSTGKLQAIIAKVGDSYYGTLQDAVNAVDGNQESAKIIKVLANLNISEPVAVTGNRNVIIENASGQDMTFTRTSTKFMFTVESGSTLAIGSANTEYKLTLEGGYVYNSETQEETGIAEQSLIQNAGTFTLDSDVTVQNANSGNANGGAIYNTGTATLCGTLTGNRAKNGAGVWSSGTVIITDGLYTNNIATNGGGVIYSEGENAAVTIEKGTFTSNQATNNTGGVIYGKASVIINGGTFTDNKANTAGGVLNVARQATITNAIMKGNSLIRTADDISGGGAIYVSGGNELTLTECIICDNAGDYRTDKNPGCDISLGANTTLNLQNNTNIGIVQQRYSNNTAIINILEEYTTPIVFVPFNNNPVVDETLVIFDSTMTTEEKVASTNNMTVRKYASETEYNDDTYYVDSDGYVRITSNVAKVGDVSYATLTEAVAAVKTSDATTIYVLRDSDMSEMIAVGSTDAVRNITITNAPGVDVTLTRSSELVREMFNVANGSMLNITGKVTVNGNEVETKTYSLVENSGTFTLGKEATLTGGNAGTAYAKDHSGGALYNASSASATLEGALTGNKAYYGGAVYNLGSLTIIDGNYSNNTANQGGALYSTGGSCGLDIQAGRFTGNSAAANGGVMNVNNNATICNAVMSDNSTTGSSGANGSAIYFRGNYTLSLKNCDISGNILKSFGSNNHGSDIALGDGSAVVLKLYNNINVGVIHWIYNSKGMAQIQIEKSEDFDETSDYSSYLGNIALRQNGAGGFGTVTISDAFGSIEGAREAIVGSIIAHQNITAADVYDKHSVTIAEDGTVTVGDIISE